MEVIALIVAVAALIIACWAWWDTHLSRLASERSAAAAEQSAAAAQESLVVQKREAAAAAEERGEAKRADIVALSWESSNRAAYRGLVIQNVGRGVAKNVRALVHHGGPVDVHSRPSLASNEMVGLLGDDIEHPATAEETSDLPEHRAGNVTIKLTWLNEDGTPGGTDWRNVRSH